MVIVWNVYKQLMDFFSNAKVSYIAKFLIYFFIDLQAFCFFIMHFFFPHYLSFRGKKFALFDIFTMFVCLEPSLLISPLHHFICNGVLRQLL